MGRVTISFEMTLDGVFDQMEHWFDPDDACVQRGLRDRYESTGIIAARYASAAA